MSEISVDPMFAKMCSYLSDFLMDLDDLCVVSDGILTADMIIHKRGTGLLFCLYCRQK